MDFRNLASYKNWKLEVVEIDGREYRTDTCFKPGVIVEWLLAQTTTRALIMTDWRQLFLMQEIFWKTNSCYCSK